MTTDRIGGCAGYLRYPDERYIDTLVTYDGIHWHLGFNKNMIIGSRKIIEATLEEIIAWYNEVNGTSFKPVSMETRDGLNDTTFYVSRD